MDNIVFGMKVADYLFQRLKEEFASEEKIAKKFQYL